MRRKSVFQYFLQALILYTTTIGSLVSAWFIIEYVKDESNIDRFISGIGTTIVTLLVVIILLRIYDSIKGSGKRRG